ncbi:hypothetical protein PIB30_077343, partial [Stylosanthes scabra]|nr:hypothetical protein [Stylosanthes scabra]
NKKVIAKCCIDLDEDEYPKVKEQIALRGWRRLAAPKQEISIDLIHEFYANAIVTEEEMEEHGEHTFRSFVRGVPVDFSPENIRTVMRFRTQVQGATTDSLIPSSNWSEIPVIRAILIHCIMRGEDVRAEDIIANKIVRMVQGIKEKEKLGFPSTIYKLYKEAGQQPEFEHHQDINEEPRVQQPPLYHVPTYTDQHQEDLHSIETQLQNMMWYQQQTLENHYKKRAHYRRIFSYFGRFRSYRGIYRRIFSAGKNGAGNTLPADFRIP